jgi:hypothetical protein
MQFPSKIEDRLGYVSFDVVGGGGSEGGGAEATSPDQEAQKAATEQQVENGEVSAGEVADATGGETQSGAAEGEGEGGAGGIVGAIGGVLGAIGNVGNAIADAINDISGNSPDKQPIKNGTPQLTEPGGSVVLYLPAGFQINEGVQYDGTDLGVAGAGAEAAIAAGGDVGGALGEAAGSFIDALKTDVGGPQGRLAAIEAARRVGKVDAGVIAGVQAASGVAVNPNQRVLFKRVNIREFRFAFTLIPVNAGEASTVQNIVKFFRHYLYPEPIGGEIKVGYKFPEKFKITVGSSLGWNAPEIKECYLRGVAITYNPNAMAFHEDGNPVETQLSLDFMEAAALDRTDVPL